MASPIWIGTTTAWATAGNWSTGSAPVDTDTAVFNGNSTQTMGPVASDQSAIELTALDIFSTFLYTIGDAASAHIIDATTVRIHLPSGSSTAGAGSGRINLSIPDVNTTVLIYGTKTSSTDTGKEPVRIKTGANTNKLILSGAGRVGVATDNPADTATFAEVACLHRNGVVNVGAGCTLTKWRQEDGIGNLFCALTTLQQDGGTVNTYGVGAITTVHCSGTANLSSSGTITTLNVNGGGIADLLLDSRTRTVTTINLQKGSTLRYDPNVVTVTNPIVLVNCNLEDVTIETPRGLTVAIVKS